jgi:type I restriction enzyme S subunit
MVDSELGQIPQGWEVKAFTDIVDVLSGGTPKTSVPEYWNGDIPFFAPKDAPSGFYVLDTEKSITDLGLSNCSSQLYEPETVFITARGTVGKVKLNAVPMAMNQSCYALRGKGSLSQAFVFFLTLHSADYLRQNTGGATFDTIIVDTFKRYRISNPPLALTSTFTETVDPLLKAINGFTSKNQNLRKTRDLLLPRLISGRLDVEELDIAV